MPSAKANDGFTRPTRGIMIHRKSGQLPFFSAQAGRPGPGARGAGCDMGETTACGEALRFVSLRDSEFVSAGMMTAKVSITARFIID